MDELEKEVENVRWFLHQIYEEQEKLKEENKDLKRTVHKLVAKEKRRYRVHILSFFIVFKRKLRGSPKGDLQRISKTVFLKTGRDSFGLPKPLL